MRSVDLISIYGVNKLVYPPSPTAEFLTMLTLYELFDIVNDNRKPFKWLGKYKIVASSDAKCPSCGARLREAAHRGQPGWKWTDKGCSRRVSAVTCGLLEGAQISPNELLVLMYFWAHDCGVDSAMEMLGHSPTTVAQWSARFRQCVC